MGFYEEIAKYYDEIFPVGKEQLDYIKGVAGNPPKAVLDIACGTGGYSIELAKEGYDVTAVDLDEQMLEELRKKTSSLSGNIRFLQANMLSLEHSLAGKQFEIAFCIGNSVVHLEDLDRIGDFFRQVKRHLSPSGSLILQTINYDRVLGQGISSLPTITNESAGLTFERTYRLDRLRNQVFFKTILSVSGQRLENEIPLFPLLQKEAEKLLFDAGFENVSCYGDFKQSRFERESSYMLVIKAG